MSGDGGSEGPRRVAILGGGIAGLTVAHELANWNERQSDPRRRYDITVFESRGSRVDDLGGKARSWEVSHPSGDALSGEHGFRFFGGFYKNVIATMAEIPVDGRTADGPSVADQLVPLTESDFYAEPMELREDFEPSPRARDLSHVLTRIAPGAAAVWLLGGPVVISLAGLPWWSALVWVAVMVTWKLARWAVEARAADGAAEMELHLRPDGSGGRRHPVAAALDHVPLVRWWWIPLVAVTVWWRPPWPVWVVVGIVALGWHFHRQVFAMTWLWRNLRGRIPHDVKPRGAESVFAFLSVVALATSCRDRFYDQWENRSWWEYIGAWRFSERYQLTLATGLTRGFVATKAERMSARTGGAILAQLIYDIDPYLTRDNAPDRVLNGPTSEVWIRPWVEHLRRRGVRFNQFVIRADPMPDEVSSLPHGPIGSTWDHGPVTVQQLLLDRTSRTTVGGFRCILEPADGAGTPAEGPIRNEFDHYVLAVSGTAAQRILGNSPRLLQLDRATPRERRPVVPLSAPEPVPFLDGIFELEFGWMTGAVFHFDHPIAGLPAGHLLCLDSEWALTAIDQRVVWAALADDPSVGTILSVNVSDWFRPSKQGLPAQFASVQEIVDEVWDQLRCHVPALHGVERPPMERIVLDTAVRDPEQNTDVTRVRRAVDRLTALPVLSAPAAPAGAAGAAPVGAAPVGAFDVSCTLELENLPLTNAEKLLVNTAGSWRSRPCATTAVPNLFVAGDYVRTQVDFASMESANEAGRWAANALIEHDAAADGADVALEPPRGLEVPDELGTIVRVFQGVDRGLCWLGWPNPASILAVPVGWFTTPECRLRDRIDRWFRPRGLLMRDR